MRRTMMFSSFRVVVCGATLAMLAAFAAPGWCAQPAHITATIGPQGITASGIPPGDRVVFFGVARIPIANAYMDRIAHWATLIDDTARAGAVTLDTKGPVPRISVWAVVDVRTADYTIVSGPGVDLRTIGVGNPLSHGSGRTIDRFVFDRPFLDLLYVHPGLGAWSWSAMDGAPTDEDGANGSTAVSLSKGKAVGNGAQPPAEFAPGGVLIAIDFTALRVAAVRVDDALIRGAR